MIINGLFTEYDDEISESFYTKQQKALSEMPKEFKNIITYFIPLRAYNITGIENVRLFLTEDKFKISEEKLSAESLKGLNDIIDELYNTNKKAYSLWEKAG